MLVLNDLEMCLKKESEIRALIAEIDSFTQTLDQISTNELESLKIKDQLFYKSPAIDLELGRIFLKRAEYTLVI